MDGEQAPPPVPDGPTLCKTSEMAMVHAAFLDTYDRAADLVRGVPAGDLARAEVVGRHLADTDASLHVHHEAEDLFLWDRLEQRAPACALHVGQMRAHHAAVAEHLAGIAPALRRWRASADPGDREDLAARYEAMVGVLHVHLRREVAEVVPVAAKVMQQDEWDQLGKHGFETIPRSRLLVQFGGLLAVLDSQDRREFYRHVPLPVRVLYRVVGRRQFERHFRALYPDRPVPATLSRLKTHA